MRTKLLHAAIFTPNRRGWGLPILFEGAPGTAKTELCEAVCEAAGLPLIALSPGLHGEGAFGVVPVPVKTPLGTRLAYPPPDWTDEVADGGVVLVDEVTTAPAALQPPMLGLIAAHRVGNHQLPSRVRVFGLCNPVELAANGQELAPPLANRFIWVSWGAPSVAEHAAFMLGAASGTELPAYNTAAEEARVLAAWPAAWARAAGLEVAFHQKTGGQWKNKCPKAADATLSRAWPSDRTWYYAALCLASSIVHGLSNADTSDLLAGCVGREAAAAWEVFVEEQDLPDVEALLDGSIEYKFDARRIDRIAAVLSNAQALVTPPQSIKRIERAAALWRLMGTVPASARDLCVPVAQALKQADIALCMSPAAAKVLAGMNKVLTLSGAA